MTQRAAHEALYLASMKRTGKIETVAERRAKNGKKGMKSRWVDNTGRDTASVTSDTPEAEAQPEPERKTAALVPARQSRIASPAILLPKAGIAP